MCRIITMYGALEGGFVSDALKKFRELSQTGVVFGGDGPGHKDGWGLVGYRDGEIFFYEKRPVTASADPEFELSVEKIIDGHSTVIVGHLRKASVGSIKLENTHPFVAGDWSFCHNGSIKINQDMAAFELDQSHLDQINGDTDSELFFLRLLQVIASRDSSDPTANIARAISDTISFVGARFDYTSLNSIITDGKRLFVLREANEENELVKKGNLRDFYYTLFLGTSDDQKTHIVCSEKLDLKGIAWTPIPNHHLLAVDLETGLQNIAPVHD